MNSIATALISVSDKTGIAAFASELAQIGVQILSTGGTASLLRTHGISVTDVSEFTGFPEMMEGRLKTLHPKIHGGLLGRRGIDDGVMQDHDIKPIDLVVVNLYPFEKTIANPDCQLPTAIENIDIGGPTLLRAAAKNYQSVTVVVDSGDYNGVIAQLGQNHNADEAMEFRFNLAVKAFEHTARYDGVIANYLGAELNRAKKMAFSQTINLQYRQRQPMRYGENPHQQGAFYSEVVPPAASIASARQLQGKALSFNNVADTDAALECVKSFANEPACVIVKHANPCGVAIGTRLLDAYERAWQTDPTSAFGGIIAFNRELDQETAEAIIGRQFVEVIIAPTVSDAALPILATKKNVRVLVCGEWQKERIKSQDIKWISGGVLVQDRDIVELTSADLTTVTELAPTPDQIRDLLFAWKIVRYVKSNAIIYCKQGQTLGIGAGQMSRVYSARIASIKAADEGLDLRSAVMASDAFFPFRDGIDSAHAAGIAAVIQPGGSMRDQEVIDAANQHGMAMVFTGVRHFRH